MTPHPILRRLFKSFDEAGLSWALLRGESRLSQPSGDVDILVASSDVEAAAGIASSTGFRAQASALLVPRWFYVAYCPEDDSWLKLDLVCEVSFGRLLEYTTPLAGVVLRRRRRAGPVALLHADDSFWHLLLHFLFDRDVIPDTARADLREQLQDRDPVGPLADFVDALGPAKASSALLEALRASDWEELGALAYDLGRRWQARRSLAETARLTAHRLLRRLDLAQPTACRPGPVVAILGPDGAGKTTLARGLDAHLELPSRYVYLGLWREGRFDDLLSLVPGLRLGASLGRLGLRSARIGYHRWRGRTVLVDRFTYDAHLVDGSDTLRQRLTAKLMLGLSLRPDLVLLLDLPGKVAFERKGEQSVEILDRWRSRYRLLEQRLPSVVRLDASAPADEVRRSASRAIWASARNGDAASSSKTKTKMKMKMKTRQARAVPTLRDMVTAGAEPASSFKPVLPAEIELSEPLPTLSGHAAAGGCEYARARVLVRLHRQPVGIVEVDFVDGAVDPAILGAQLCEELGGLILAHLQDDGMWDRPDVGLDSLPLPAGCTAAQRHPTWQPLVSVVVCTCGRPRQLDASLRALLEMDYPDFEVIVVDNRPDDPSTARLLREQYGQLPRVRYAAEAEPGLSRARNRAISLARGEIVAFTDDDIVVDRHWVSALVAGFDEDGEVACVTGVTLAARLETPSQYWFEGYGTFSHGFDSKVFSRNCNPSHTALYPYTAGVFGGGGNSAVRLSSLRTPLRFDPRMGAGTPTFGGEDLDIFLDVIFQGRRIRYQPSAIAWHEHRRSYEDVQWQVFGYGAGLTAVLTKWSLQHPGVASDLLKRVPLVLPRALLPRRADAPGGSELPVGLSRLERIGFFYGPISYFRACLMEARRSAKRRPATLPGAARRRWLTHSAGGAP